MGNPFAALGHFFKSAFGRLVHWVTETFTEAQTDIAIAYVEQAATMALDNAGKRAWVSAQLQKDFHLSESVANFLTELALQGVKRGLKKGAEALDGAIAPPA